MEKKPKIKRSVIYTGTGMAIGAALGMLFGLMGSLCGVLVGAAVGLIWETQNQK